MVDFKRGELDNVALSNPGYLTLSYKVTSFFDSKEPYLWAWCQDLKGNIYVGTGNEGKVYKISPKGESSVFFDTDELEIYALAHDQQNNIYVATSPDGKIYKVTAAGKGEVYFDPPDNYIWDLVFDRQKNLFAATGDSSRIYKITGKNKGKIYFQSDESHIEELYIQENGDLLAGTVDNGYLYRISTDGKPVVLFDTGFREIHSIAMAKDGSIYIGGYGRRRPERMEPSKLKQSTKKKKKKDDTEKSEAQNQMEEIGILIGPEPMSGMGRSEMSAVLKISPGGARQNIWHLPDAVYALTLNPDGSLLVGTGGDNGKLYRVNQDEEETLIMEIDDAQITALYRNNKNQIFMCTSNMGKVYKINQDYESKGSFISRVMDAGIVSDWGVLRWQGELPSETKVKIYTRSGNTAEVNETWNQWSKPITVATGEPIQSAPAQYLQWKAEFSSSKKTVSPKLEQLTITYLQHNLPPKIKKLVVNDTEDLLEDTPEEDNEYSQEQKEGNEPQYYSPVSSRQLRNRALRTIRWSCTDANRDRLKFKLTYKGEKENSWRELKSDYYEYFYRWNSEKWPDGFYQIQLTASDSPSNPLNLIKNSRKISDRFKVDNAGPAVHTFKVKPKTGDKLTISFIVQDRLTALYSAEFVIDSGEWQLVYPRDGICDSSQEKYELKIPGISPGNHTFVVRTYDRYLNVGFGKFNFKIE